MDVPVDRVDDYTMGLIEADIVRFFPIVHTKVGEPQPEPDPEVDGPEVETKVVRRGRPRRNPSVEVVTE